MKFDFSKLATKPAYRRKIEARSREKEKRNAFFEHYLSKSFLTEKGDHLPIMQRGTSDFGPVTSLNAAERCEEASFDPNEYAFFTNPLRLPHFGPKYENQSEHAKKWEPPSARPTVGNFLVFTLEYDPDTPAGFEKQLDWLWKEQGDGLTCIVRADQFFRRNYKDYRGYCVVFGGNKSLHFHFVFDSTWMQREAIETWAKINNRNPKQVIKSHYKGDISQDAIWPYHRERWRALVKDFRKATGIDVLFDNGMATLCQKRRLPWGLRIEEKANNIHGCLPGDKIPQIVLEERIIVSSPKGAERYFLRAEEANEIEVHRVESRARSTIHFQTDEDRSILIEKVNEYLNIAWGRDYPRLARVDDAGGGYFFNHAGDGNPSTYCGPGETWIGYAGEIRPAATDVQHLPGRLTFEQLLDEIISSNESIAKIVKWEMARPSLKFGQSPWYDIIMEKRLLRSPTQGAVTALAPSSDDLSRQKPYCVIHSVEGAGKSRGLLANASSYRLDDCGHAMDDDDSSSDGRREMDVVSHSFFPEFGLTPPDEGLHVYASPSYSQAEEQYLRYLRGDEAFDGGQSRRAVLLKSFRALYQECFKDVNFDTDGFDPAGQTNYLFQGYGSLVSFVFHEQKPIYKEIRRRARGAVIAQQKSGKAYSLLDPNYDIMVFTCKDLAQRLHETSLSLAAIHPEFDYGHHVVDGSSALNDEGRGLVQSFRPYRIIHDEIDLADVVMTAFPAEVDFARAITERKHQTDVGPKPWSELNTVQRFNAFLANRDHGPKDMTFYRFQEVVSANMQDIDAWVVDFDQFPFGTANTEEAAYLQRHGDTIYLKQREWWSECRARVVFLTTEALMADIMSKATFSMSSSGNDKPGSDREFSIGRWAQPDWFEPDYIPMKQSNLANKKGIDQLVTELTDPNSGGYDQVIANMASGNNVISHPSAKGRNDLDTTDIATVLTYMGETQYVVLNVVAQMFNVDDPISKFYRDQINQAMGRNRGQRRLSSPAAHLLVLSPRLFRELGKMKFFGSGRYRFYSLGQ